MLQFFSLRKHHFALACRFAAVSAAFFIVSSVWAQNIWHVDATAPANGNGQSWNSAFSSLQVALDAAVNETGQPSVIKVAQGRYVPTQLAIPGDPRSATFQLSNNCSILGGYAGLSGGGNPDERDPDQFTTTLSGDLAGNDQPSFLGYDENSYHVLTASNTDTTCVLDGVTISGGNANVSGDLELAMQLGGGLFADTSAAIIRDCNFTANHAQSGGGVYTRGITSMRIEGCLFSANRATNWGSALRHFSSLSAVIDDCEFRDNIGASGTIAVANIHQPGQQPGMCTVTRCHFAGNSVQVGGGIYSPSPVTIEDCTFVENNATIGGGALQVAGATVRRCEFTGNQSGYAGGAINVAYKQTHIENCTFIDNTSNYIGGALSLTSDSGLTHRVINCVFSRNDSPDGGGVLLNGGGTIFMDNCTLVGNTRYGIMLIADSTIHLKLQNSIIWGNGVSPIVRVMPGQPSPPSSFGGNLPYVTVSHSNVDGGWDGAGNIDALPLFVQPGCDNYRLTHDSPCVNAGSNALIPPGITIDLAGNPRIQAGTVDMGAYEGGHDPLPLMACAEGLMIGEQARLVPIGGVPQPLLRAASDLINEGVDNASATVTQESSLPINPGAGGFVEIGHALDVQSSIQNGQMYSRVSIPFDASNLNGFNPQDVELMVFDPSLNRWRLAVETNVQTSPGHGGPVGDRHVKLSTTNGASQWGWNWELGDHGVFWNTAEQRGFAWAIIDRNAQYSIGIRLPDCAGDCKYPPDGVVNVQDLTVLMSAWGVAVTGPSNFADINRDGFVNVPDMLALIQNWGVCD